MKYMMTMKQYNYILKQLKVCIQDSGAIMI